MAGASNPRKSAWPHGENSGIVIAIGGYVPQGKTAFVVGNWIASFDCYVTEVSYTYTQIGSADLDALLLKTVDSTAKTIVASQDPSADIAGVKQTLHSDIAGFIVVTGNVIQLTADSASANEEGNVMAYVTVRPVYA